jgi:hypothetical protein
MHHKLLTVKSSSSGKLCHARKGVEVNLHAFQAFMGIVGQSTLPVHHSREDLDAAAKANTAFAKNRTLVVQSFSILVC